MAHTKEVKVGEVKFTSLIDKTDEQILRAAVRYLLLQIRDKKDISKEEIEVTPWLEKE